MVEERASSWAGTGMEKGMGSTVSKHQVAVPEGDEDVQDAPDGKETDPEGFPDGVPEADPTRGVNQRGAVGKA